MSRTGFSDTLALVTAPDTASVKRGAEIERRREAAGLSVAKLTRLARIGSRNTTYAAFKGKVEPETFKALEDALTFAEENPDDLDEQPGAVQRLGDENFVEFEVDVDAIGVRVVVRGPGDQRDQLREDVSKIIRDMRREARDSQD